MKTNLSAVKTIGSGLARPEGVMALDDGTLPCSSIAQPGMALVHNRQPS